MRRFALRLAVKLGHVDVDGMLASITWRQFVEWMAFYSVEPFGEERADVRSADVVAAIYNVNRDVKKRSVPYTWKDFIIPFGDYVQKVTKVPWQDLKAKLRGMYEANVKANARKKRGEG